MPAPTVVIDLDIIAENTRRVVASLMAWGCREGAHSAYLQVREENEIARALYLSPNSIKTYVRTAYRKIGAASRSQAVSWAIRHGFPTHRETEPDR